MNHQATPHVGDADRLAALDSYGILDTPAEAGFDDVVRLATRLCATPVGLVSFVAAGRQWFKARVNFPPCETDLDRSVCKFVLDEPDVLQITDLAADPRTRDNPLVTGEPFIRFYAGAPLRGADGLVLGSLCVIDTRPRPGGLTPEQADDLRALARQVMSQIELRQSIALRDAARRRDQRAFHAREALREAQAVVAEANDDLRTILRAVVDGAMRAVPEAEGGTVELIDDGKLEYHAVRGTLAGHAGFRVPLAGSLSGYCAQTRLAQRMADAHTDPHVRRDLIDQLGLRSAIVAPIVREGAVLGVLKLQSSRSDAFTGLDLEIIGLFAGAATAGFAAAEGRALVRARDMYWRGLFDRLSEGFIVGELMRDGSGQAVDWRYLEVNPAWGELVGVDPVGVAGRTIREVFPGVEDEWVGQFARVVEDRQTATFTRQVGTLRRWYDGRAFPLDGERFGVLSLEVTARVEAEARRTALLALGDRLRDLTTTAEMIQAAAEIVGRTLGATRAGFGRIEGDVEAVEIEPDWTAPGVTSIAGRHRFDDYGDIRAHLQRGEALVIDDVGTDARTRDGPEPMRALGIGALVNMPVRERDRTVAVFIVHDAGARGWSADELAFLRNVADRLEAAVARVRAEDRQAVLNREIAHRLKNTLAIVQAIAAQTLRDPPDLVVARKALSERLLALSRAHDALMAGGTDATTVAAVVDGTLALHDGQAGRIRAAGPPVEVGPSAALSLALMLHELATNAAKYGALSVPAGHVDLAWAVETDDGSGQAFTLTWAETGGPPVAAPSRRGFGSRLIERGFGGDARVTLAFAPSGVVSTLRIPLAALRGGDGIR